MRIKFFLIFIFLICFKLNGFVLEKEKSICLEKLKNINYNKTSTQAKRNKFLALAYDVKNDFLFITLLSNQPSADKGINTSFTNKSSEKLAVFDKTGKYIGSVGKFNSYENGGIVSITNIKIINDKIYINDYLTQRVSVYTKNDSTFIFNYSIDTSDIMRSYGFYIKDDNLYGSKPNNFLSENNNAGFLAKIVENNYPKSRKLNYIKSFLPCTEYRSMTGYDYKKDFKEKGYDIEEKNRENPNLKYIYEMIATSGIYSCILYETKGDTVYAINTFGSDLIKFDDNLNKLDAIRVEEFHEFRKEEIEIYRNIENRKTSFCDKYSKLRDIFINKDKNYIILYYSITTEMEKRKGFGKCLFVYSENKDKFISTFYPIDFLPIESYDNKIVGVEFKEEKPWLVYYLIKK